jgi:hypothetical protein
MEFEWEPGSELSATPDDDGATRIRGNAAGLTSLAHHLLRIAAPDVYAGYDLHLDDGNGLEAGSIELILERA